MSSHQASALKHPHAPRRLSVTAPVALLLRPCGPAAVARLVVAIVVDAVQRVISRRSPAHVGEERFVGDCPSLTDGDPSAAIVSVLFVAGTQATSAHASPRRVFCGHGCSLAVLTAAALTTRHFGSETAATARLKPGQSVSERDVLVATIALAKPFNAWAWCVGSFDHREAPDSLSDVENDGWRHVTLRPHRLHQKERYCVA